MDKNSKIQRSIILTVQMKEDLEQIAKTKYMSVNDVIRIAISEYIKENKKDETAGEK